MSLSELVADLKGLVSQSAAPQAISVAHMFDPKVAAASTPTTAGHGSKSQQQPQDSRSFMSRYGIVIFCAVIAVACIAFVYWMGQRLHKNTLSRSQEVAESGITGTAGSSPRPSPRSQTANPRNVHFSDKVEQQEYEPEDAPVAVRRGAQAAATDDLDDGIGIGGGGIGGDDDQTRDEPDRLMIPIEGSDVWG